MPGNEKPNTLWRLTQLGPAFLDARGLRTSTELKEQVANQRTSPEVKNK
jgi:hypothetical protein